MSGLAGNISALTTIWTHDVYRASITRSKSDDHYVIVGRLSTLIAILLSIATAYLALSFSNIMDYLQLLFSLFNAPLLATFLLGMFTTWATPRAGFWGLLLGTLASIGHNFAYRIHAISYGSDMSANFYGAIFAFLICLALTTIISIGTTPKPLTALTDLTFWTASNRDMHLPRRVLILALLALFLFAVVSIWLR
jgi:SSS family solute:Na+ symporter